MGRDEERDEEAWKEAWKEAKLGKVGEDIDINKKLKKRFSNEDDV